MDTIERVINDLGGPLAIAKKMGIAQPAVSLWKSRGKIPPEHFFALSEALKAIGAEPPAKALFGFTESWIEGGSNAVMPENRKRDIPQVSDAD